MADTLATLKEQHQVSPVAQLSQILAPRYITRSRTSSDVRGDSEVASKTERSEDVVSIDTMEEKHDLSADETGTHSTVSETLSTSDSPMKSSVSVKSENMKKRKSATINANASASQQQQEIRKRGRHKEYTAPTGVWKTNGGYISTIYVGNRRIYGPLRDNPEEAGYDRQRLIEAKTFVKNEIEMRNFIATLKTPTSGSVTPTAALTSALTPAVQQPPLPSSTQRRVKPVLTTITSIPTTIEPEQEVVF